MSHPASTLTSPNLYGNDVAVLDLKEQKGVARIPVDSKPWISFSPVTVSARPATKIELPMNHEGAAEMEATH